MTEIETVHFGAELKDGFKPVNAWVSTGISWLEDIQQFYRERSVIEKEYSVKLSTLAKKYYEKKAKKSGSISVGDTPTLTPGSLESASLTTWTTQLSTLERRAAEHDRFSAELTLQISEPLKNISLRYEELRKSHVEFAAKLEKERDAGYAALKRSKGQYDGVCQEVETRRKKIETSFDSSKNKAQNAYQQQILDMHNVKNTYIISINVTNKQKEKYYHEYVPDLLNSLQDVSETRVKQLNSIWSHAVTLEKETLSTSVDYLQNLLSEIPRNHPRMDSLMFARHNVSPWQEPHDMVFEPSPVWHDDDAMAVDETAKIFLRNILGKSKSQISELKRETDRKRRELENVNKVRQNIRDGKDKRDEVEVVRAMFFVQEGLHEVESKRLAVEVEISTIKGVVGDISLGARNHNFKSQTFKIPTNCDLCGERIWGLSAKGFDCRDCGYTCHSKCELKVPANCPGEQSKEEKKKLKSERQITANATTPQSNGGPADGVAELPAISRSNTMDTLSSGFATSAHRSVAGAGPKIPAEEANQDRAGSSQLAAKPVANASRRNRVIAPPPTSYVSDAAVHELNGNSIATGRNNGEQRGKMIYPYQASGEGEVSVKEGSEVVVVDPDDGSGWMTVQTSRSTGIVPATYVELVSAANSSLDRPQSTHSNSSASVSGSVHIAGTNKKKGPAVAPKKGAKKLNYVVALYDYEARSEAECSMKVGEKYVLVNKDAGDGWADVEKGGQTKSVPALYIRDV